MKIKWLRKCEEKSSAPQISLTDKIERCERNLFEMRNNFRALALMFAALIAIQLRSLFIGFAARLLNLGNSKFLQLPHVRFWINCRQPLSECVASYASLASTVYDSLALCGGKHSNITTIPNHPNLYFCNHLSGTRRKFYPNFSVLCLSGIRMKRKQKFRVNWMVWWNYHSESFFQRRREIAATVKSSENNVTVFLSI